MFSLKDEFISCKILNIGSFLVFILLWLIRRTILNCHGYGAHLGREAISFRSKSILFNSYCVPGTLGIISRNEGSVLEFQLVGRNSEFIFGVRAEFCERNHIVLLLFT